MQINDIGKELKTAREAANVSIERVAEALRLTTDKIEALENNHFDALSAPTYVTGYIRSYCHEIAINPDEFVQAYLDKDDVVLPELNPTSNQPRQINAKSPLFVSATVLVLAIILSLISFWAWETFQQIQIDNTVVEDETTTVLPEIELVLAEENSENAPAAIDDSDTSETALDEIYASDVIPVQVENESDTVLNDSTTITDNTAESEEQQLPDNSINAANIDQQQDLDIAVVPGGIAPEGNDRLTINVSNESWVNVQDSNGYRLFYGMRYANQGQLILSGQAPFDVVIGDARVTSVLLNDTDFNVTRFQRADNSARFLVR